MIEYWPLTLLAAAFLLAVGWEAGKLAFRFLLIIVFRPGGTPLWPFTDRYE